MKFDSNSIRELLATVQRSGELQAELPSLQKRFDSIDSEKQLDLWKDAHRALHTCQSNLESELARRDELIALISANLDILEAGLATVAAIQAIQVRR